MFGLIVLLQLVDIVFTTAHLASYHCFVFQPVKLPWACMAADNQLVPTTAAAVSTGLWVLALVVWVVGRGMPASAIFFLGCIAASGALSTGNKTIDQPTAVRLLFGVFTCTAGLLFFLSYRSLLDDPVARAWRKRPLPQISLWLVLGACVGTILLDVSPLGLFHRWLWQAPLGAFWAPAPGLCGPCSPFPDVAAAAVYLTFIGSILATLAYAVAGYRSTTEATTRRRLRLLLLGNAVAYLPMVLLSMVPDVATNGNARIPFGLTFPFLLLYPLSYLYALFAGHLTRLEPRLSAAATYYLSAIVLLGLYLVTAGVLGQLATAGSTMLATDATATLLVVLAAFPLRNAIQRVVHWAWVDETTDPLRLTTLLTERLKLTVDAEDLDRHLITTLPDGLCLTGAALLRRVEDEDWLRASGSGALAWIQGSVPLDAQITRQLVTHTADGGPLTKPQTHVMVLAALAAAMGSPANRFAREAHPDYTMPLVLHDELRGVLLLGPRRLPDREDFTPAEVQCLATIAYQAAVTLHNIELVTHAASAHERFGMEMARRLDRERARIGDDLHNGPIQQMVALGYLIDEMEHQSTGEGVHATMIRRVRAMTRTVAEDLRSLMYSVESPRVVGFGPALSSALDAIRAQPWVQVPTIHAEITPDLPAMPDDVADCLVDIVREAVVNACKHARAAEVRVTVQPHPMSEGAGIMCEVIDDGHGFALPEEKGSLSRRHHTGIFRMRRRAEMAAAQLMCDSTPGSGTHIQVVWPAPGAEGALMPQSTLRGQSAAQVLDDQEDARG